MLHKFSFCWILIVLNLMACVPPSEEVLTDVELDYSGDRTLQRLYDFQDQLLTDSLITFFDHRDPTYRYAAAMAFASVKDTHAIRPLSTLLTDEIPEVRTAAAYALGQIGDVSAQPMLIQAFNRNDSVLVDQKFNAAVLEAVGKCGTEEYLLALSTVTTFTRLDTLLLEGQAWGIYRFAVRGITNGEGTARMIEFLTGRGYPPRVRLIASNYLYRARKLSLDETDTKKLADLLVREADPNIRMTLAIALGKSGREAARDALLEWYAQEPDFRVKCNIIRALYNFDYGASQALVMTALTDVRLPVAKTAAQFLIDKGEARDASHYWRLAKTPLPWQVQARLYGAAHAHLPGNYQEYKENINREILRRFKNTNNPYERAALVSAMQYYVWNYRNIHDVGYASDEPIVRTATVQALANIARHPEFERRFRGRAPIIKRELAEYFIEAVNKSDIAMVALAANVLRDTNLHFETLIDSTEFLNRALGRLTLPKDLETYKEVRQAINYFETGDAGSIDPPVFNHPIEWRKVKAIGANTKATVQTSKGQITLMFFPQLAPATVANFIDLAKNGFFRGKYFHRIVDNFVVQTGCPRGDGYGGLNYSIRSELPPAHYDEAGYVGMASSGNHTESTQWFITHSPALHLDGNYTLFAKVTEGLDIVYQIEQGDTVKEVTIEN